MIAEILRCGNCALLPDVGSLSCQLNYSEENLKQARAALERLTLLCAAQTKPLRLPVAKRLNALYRGDERRFQHPGSLFRTVDMAREVNRLKAEDMAAANAWRLTCVNFLPYWACWSKNRNVPAKRCAGRRQRSG